MPKKKIYRTTIEFTCPNNHLMIFVQEGDTPEPPFCLSCLTLWLGKNIKGVEEKK